MSDQPLRFLATADVHLGRSSTHVGEEISKDDTATRIIWMDIVELAIERQVEAVLLAGDIIDQENRYFEAWGPLEAGLKQLSGADIRTFAVAGNHDHSVFPRLMEDMGAETFTLLGARGQWEQVTFAPDGHIACNLIGWSFPKQHHSSNPLADFNLDLDRSVPTIALLHTQLNDPKRLYAPVPNSELGQHDIDFWLLGHVHKPQQFKEGSSDVLYCGSPQAMNPGETDIHGPWLITVEPSGEIKSEQIPISRVRYESLPVDLGSMTTTDEVDAELTRAVSEFADSVAIESDGHLRALSLRVTLRGRTTLHRELPQLVNVVREDLRLTHGRMEVVVDDIVVNTQPALDVAELAKGQDMAGELARLILALEREDDGSDHPVLRSMKSEINTWQSSVHTLLPEDASEQLRAELLMEARQLLDTLIAGKETA